MVFNKKNKHSEIIVVLKCHLYHLSDVKIKTLSKIKLTNTFLKYVRSRLRKDKCGSLAFYWKAGLKQTQNYHRVLSRREINTDSIWTMDLSQNIIHLTECHHSVTCTKVCLPVISDIYFYCNRTWLLIETSGKKKYFH